MQIIPIFDGEISPLLSIKYDKEELDEFSRLFDLWSDVEYLTAFFTDNEKDLKSGFFDEITIEQAVRETLDDAQKFEKKIIELAESSDFENYSEGLESLFTPLHKNGISYELNFSKAYGKNENRKNSWLRMYAIKIGTNVYMITGGAIKLTQKMNQANHTITELDKFRKCLDYLKEESILEPDALKDYFNID